MSSLLSHKDVADYLDVICEIGYSVRHLSISSEKSEKLIRLAPHLPELARRISECIDKLNSDFNNSNYEHSLFEESVGNASNLTNLMIKTMSEPCRENLGAFKKRIIDQSPLKIAHELAELLDKEYINSTINNDEFDKWRIMFETLLTHFLFLEAYNTGITWDKDIDKSNQLKNKIEKLLKKIDKSREDYIENLQAVSKKMEQISIHTPELVNKGPENNELLLRLLRNEVKYDDFKKRFEINQNKLTTFKNKIGEGHFGYVVQGVLFHNGKQLKVAVKGSNNPNDKIEQELFIAELTVMCAIPKHPNILSLIGGITTHPVQIVMELIEDGDLLSLLRRDDVHYNFKDLLIRSDGKEDKFRDINLPMNDNRLLFNTFDLISIAYQIANGMMHLAHIPCVHRDLALRNILISVNKTIRIADFGLARKHKNDYYRPEDPDKVGLPKYWTAPEAMSYDKFTERSDVWSYGVCLYELFTLGMTPTVDGQSLHQSDKPLPRPDYCPSKIYKHMTTYWDKDPDLRPNFSGCVDLMRSVLKSCGNQIYEKVQANLQEATRKQEEFMTYV